VRPSSTINSIVALLLTFAAGFVDIVGFIALLRTFTAHMTGNTVHAAYRLASGREGDGLFAIAVIAAFLGGSIIGRALIEAAARQGVRRIASITLALEAALIAVVAFSDPQRTGHAHVLLLLLSTAMGLQTASLTKVGPLTVHTTFVTGMLNKLAQLISRALFLSYDTVVRKQPLQQHRRRVFRDASFIFSIWLLYLSGAGAGTRLTLDWKLHALIIPLGLLALAVCADLLRPLSLQEEKDELEAH